MEENYELYQVDYEQQFTNTAPAPVPASPPIHPFFRQIPTRWNKSYSFSLRQGKSDTTFSGAFSDSNSGKGMKIPMYTDSENENSKVERTWKRILWTVIVIGSVFLMACIVSAIYLSAFPSGVHQPGMLLASSSSSANKDVIYQTEDKYILQSATNPTKGILRTTININRHPEKSNAQSPEKFFKTSKTKHFKIEPSVTLSSPIEWVSTTQTIHNSHLQSDSLIPSSAIWLTTTISPTSIKGIESSESDSPSESPTGPGLFTDLQTSSNSIQSSNDILLSSSDAISSRNILHTETSTNRQNYQSESVTTFSTIPTFKSSDYESIVETSSSNMLIERNVLFSSESVIVQSRRLMNAQNSTKAISNLHIQEDSTLYPYSFISSEYQTEENDFQPTLNLNSKLSQSTISNLDMHTRNVRTSKESQLISQLQHSDPIMSSIFESTFSSISEFQNGYEYSSKHQTHNFSSSNEISTSSYVMHMSPSTDIKPTNHLSTFSSSNIPRNTVLESYSEKSSTEEFGFQEVVSSRISTPNLSVMSSDRISSIPKTKYATHATSFSTFNSNSSFIEAYVTSSSSIIKTSDSLTPWKSDTESPVFIDVQTDSKHVESSTDNFYIPNDDLSLQYTQQTGRLITSSQVSSTIEEMDFTSPQDHLASSAPTTETKSSVYYISSEGSVSFTQKSSTSHSGEMTYSLHPTKPIPYQSKYSLTPNPAITEASSIYKLPNDVDTSTTDSNSYIVLQSTVDSSDSTNNTISSIQGTFLTLNYQQPSSTTNIASIYFDSTEHSLSEVTSASSPSSILENRNSEMSLLSPTITVFSSQWTNDFNTEMYTGSTLSDSEFSELSSRNMGSSFRSVLDSISITDSVYDQKSFGSSPSLSKIHSTEDYMYLHSSIMHPFPSDTLAQSERQDQSKESLSFLSERSLLTVDRDSMTIEHMSGLVDSQSKVKESTDIYSILSESNEVLSTYQTADELTTPVLLDDSFTSMQTVVSSTFTEETTTSASVIPAMPVVSFPVEIVENKILETFKCSVETVDRVSSDFGWSVDFPDGRRIDNYSFSDSFPNVTIKCTESHTCNYVSTFRPKLNMSWHNSSLCCYINQGDLKHSTCKDILIIPSNYCAVNNASNIFPHPYDACNFISCGAGNSVHVGMCSFTTCYNEDAKTCIGT